MKTTLVAHLAVVGLLFGSAGADVMAQDSSHGSQDEDSAGTPRPRLKLPRARSAPTAPTAPSAPHAVIRTAPAGETPKLGVMINITDDGLVIAEVSDGSLAKAAGMKPGDMLLKMDGRSIDDVDDIRAALQDTRPGGTLSLTVVRDGKGLVKLETDIPQPKVEKSAPDVTVGPDGHQGGFLGVQLGESGDGGVVVDGVVEQSAAWFAGLDEGDVLLKIGKTQVKSGQDVVGAIASLAPGAFVKVVYERDGETQSARARLGSRAPTPGALGSLLSPNSQGNLRFSAPGAGSGAGAHVMPKVRVFNSQDGDFPFAIQGHGDGAQVFTFGGDGDHDGHGGLWVTDDDGDGANVFTFDSDDIDGWVEDFSGHGNSFMLNLDDLEGLEGLEGLGSLGITFEDGVLIIDRDGEVQEIDLHDLEGLEELHGHGDLDGDAHGLKLNVLPKKLIQRFQNTDGNTRFNLRVKRSGDALDSSDDVQVRRLSFTPGAQVITTTTTTVDGGDCSSQSRDSGCSEAQEAECAEAVQETGDVN